MKIKKISCLIISFILVIVICLEFPSCNDAEKSTETLDTEVTETETQKATQKHTVGTMETMDILADPDLDRYNMQKYMYPIWKSDTSFAEAAFVRENYEGIVDPIKLLYPIEEIISVRSADLKTVYSEGIDYRVTEDGELEIIEGGDIPVLKYNEYYFPSYSEENSGQIPAADSSGGAYIYSETTAHSPGMTAWTLAVTYRHSEDDNISAPVAKSEKFDKLIKKLENQEEIKVAVYGDSISVGWASTGHVSRAPYCPSYTDLVCKYITQTYAVYAGKLNFAISGKTATWGADRTNLKYVYDSQPDLVILAFGMNDGVNTDTSTYIRKINYMISTIKEKSPDTCIVVVSSMLPNAEVGYSGGTSLLNYHTDYAQALLKAEKKWTNAAVADVTSIHQQLLERKVFQDTTSSNTNHPNDYMHRIYAQVIFQTIFGDYGDYK